MSGRQQRHTDGRAHSVHNLTVRNQEEKKHYDINVKIPNILTMFLMKTITLELGQLWTKIKSRFFWSFEDVKEVVQHGST